MKTAPPAPARVAVVIPAYREETRISRVVTEVLKYCKDVIVVDDGSPDRTGEVAKAAGATVLKHDVNQGKGVSLNTGFQYVRKQGFDVVITMDADGQHAPAELPKFIEAYERTHIPVLIGSRMAELKTMPRVRRWTNLFMSWLLSRLMGQYVADTQCGFRLYRCDVLPFVPVGAERFAAESETLLRMADRGIRMDSVRISTIYGDEKSKINPVTDTVRFFGMLLKYKREKQRKRSKLRNPLKE
ncbi:MAG TPA: glycosyltransferase family 2 protein [Kiritimatiellia bacterium]|jgi:glycosyltransferase involved in cell wall biosynthesis